MQNKVDSGMPCIRPPERGNSTKATSKSILPEMIQDQMWKNDRNVFIALRWRLSQNETSTKYCFLRFFK